ncbi:hypothetical protein K6H11_000008 [Candida tropicalis]
MRYSALLTSAIALSAVNATFLPFLCGGSGLGSLLGGSSGGSSGGSTSTPTQAPQTPCEESAAPAPPPCETSTAAAPPPCETTPAAEPPCEEGASGSATSATNGEDSISSAPPTDMMSQMIGGLSNMLETGFSGSGSLLHNLIG